MHLENGTPDRISLAAATEVLAALVGLGRPAPHPASSTPLRSAAAVSRRARGGASLLIWTLSAGDIRFSLMAYVPAWVRPPWDRSYAVGGYDGALLLAG